MLTPFKLDMTNPTRPQLEVAGEDLTARYSIKRISLDLPPGDVPSLYLELAGEGIVEGEAVIVQRVTQPAGGDVRQALLAFVGALDPVSVEKAVLARGGAFGADESTGEAFLAVIKEMLGGNSNGS